MNVRTFLLTLLLAFASLGLAAPSTFPENAAHFSVGYNGDLGIKLGGEYVFYTPYVDTSADLTLFADLGETYGARLSGTALVFPAIDTDPPLALGVGADIGVSTEATSFHLGPVVGSDLLFVIDLPMTVSGYLAPGYATNTGFSLAWALQVRYYFDTFALELASTDLLPVSLGVRYLL